MFLYHVSELLYPDSDVVPRGRAGIFSCRQHSDGDPVPASAAVPGVTAVWSRPGRTCHLASSLLDKSVVCMLCGNSWPCHPHVTRGSGSTYRSETRRSPFKSNTSPFPQTLFHRHATIIASPQYQQKRVPPPPPHPKPSTVRDAT